MLVTVAASARPACAFAAFPAGEACADHETSVANSDLYDITSSHLFPRCTSDVHPLERCSIRFTPQIANSDWTVAEARSKLGSHRFWIDQLVPAVASAFGVEHTVDGLAWVSLSLVAKSSQSDATIATRRHDLTVHLVGPESIVYATARALQLVRLILPDSAAGC